MRSCRRRRRRAIHTHTTPTLGSLYLSKVLREETSLRVSSALSVFPALLQQTRRSREPSGSAAQSVGPIWIILPVCVIIHATVLYYWGHVPAGEQRGRSRSRTLPDNIYTKQQTEQRVDHCGRCCGGEFVATPPVQFGRSDGREGI
jgi:hypothetical protein